MNGNSDLTQSSLTHFIQGLQGFYAMVAVICSIALLSVYT